MIQTDDYRYQWMDASKTVLHKRWDCTPDHPKTTTFPHHIYVGDELTIMLSQSPRLIDLLDLLEHELE